MTDCIVDSKQILEALQSPFDIKHIEWRVQSAAKNNNGFRVLVLPYITSRVLMDRLDDVCGGYWQSHYDKIVMTGAEAFQCRLSLKIGKEWITRTDAAEVSDIQSVKGGHSNALKRAGVQWGIGRYLYELKPFWVEVKERGEHNVYGNFKVNAQQTLVKGYIDSPKLPSWALPAGSPTSQHQKSEPKTQQQQPVQNQKSEPNTQQPRQQEQPVQKRNRTPAEEHANAVTLVTELLKSLQVPEEYVGPLLQRTSGATVPMEQASTVDLGKLYHALIPVKTYLAACRQYGLDEERMLYYAQIVLKERLENVYSLLLKLTKENCAQTLELIREDIKEAIVV